MLAVPCVPPSPAAPWAGREFVWVTAARREKIRHPHEHCAFFCVPVPLLPRCFSNGENERWILGAVFGVHHPRTHARVHACVGRTSQWRRFFNFFFFFWGRLQIEVSGDSLERQMRLSTVVIIAFIAVQIILPANYYLFRKGTIRR